MKDGASHSIQADEMIPGNCYFCASPRPKTNDLEFIFKFENVVVGDPTRVYYSAVISNEKHFITAKHKDANSRKASIDEPRYVRKASTRERKWLEASVAAGRYVSEDELEDLLWTESFNTVKNKQFKVVYINDDGVKTTAEVEGTSLEIAESKIKDIKTKLYHIEN